MWDILIFPLQVSNFFLRRTIRFLRVRKWRFVFDGAGPTLPENQTFQWLNSDTLMACVLVPCLLCAQIRRCRKRYLPFLLRIFFFLSEGGGVYLAAKIKSLEKVILLLLLLIFCVCDKIKLRAEVVLLL